MWTDAVTTSAVWNYRLISRTRKKGRRAIELSKRERGILITFYANPEFDPSTITHLLGLLPGELHRLLRLKMSRELLNNIQAQGLAPAHFWPDYRLPDGSECQAIRTPRGRE